MIPNQSADETGADPIHQSRSITVARHRDELANALWKELTEQRYKILGSTLSGARCIFELSENLGAPIPTAQCGVRTERLRQLLTGELQKSMAMTRDLSVTTIASSCGDVLAAMGLPRRLRQVPYLLVRAAHVDAGLSLPPCEVWRDGDRHFVGVPRPELLLESILSPCELSVIGLMLEGVSNRGIAQRRGVAVRTVANQVASVFRKTEVSGRIALLCALVRMEARRSGELPVS